MVVSLHSSVRAYLPNCGLPDVSEMQSQGLVLKFAQISALLVETHNVDPKRCSPLQLATIIAKMRCFLDRFFGREGKPLFQDSSQQFTIWPARIFFDFSPNGSLLCIFQSIFSFLEQFNIEAIDFDDDAKFNLHRKLVLHVHNALTLKRFLPVVAVYPVSSINEKELEKLHSIAKRRNIRIVSNPNSATHILYTDPPQSREHQTDHQVIIRVLDYAEIGKQPKYFVHWFYHPDSYNDWVPQRDVLGHIFKPKPRQPYRPWHLQARWLRDLHLYGEWMNELDYEMPLSFTDFEGNPPLRESFLVDSPLSQLCLLRIPLRTSAGQDRLQKSDLPGSISSLKELISNPRHFNQGEPEVGLERMDSPLLQTSHSASAAVLDNPASSDFASQCHDSIRGTDPVGAVGDTNKGDLNEVDASKESKAAVDDGDSEDDEPLIRQLTGSTANVGPSHPNHPSQIAENITLANGVLLPAFSAWFQLDNVHQIEKRALPEFFSERCPSKTKATYTEIRNFLVLKWRETPKQYLSTSFARRCIAGDACSIFRIHAFLSHWGLINYLCPINVCLSQLDTGSSAALPTLSCRKTGSNLKDWNLSQEPCFTLDNGSLTTIYSQKVTNRSSQIMGIGHDIRGFKEPTAPDVGDESTSMSRDSLRNSVEYHCDSCGVDCSHVRFHCTIKADMDLCPTCYHSGRFSAELQHPDFIQMASASSPGTSDDGDANSWTENELLLLLEGLAMFGDDWHLVADHVGSKAQEQCVMQFLRLVIEDPFLRKSRFEWWHRHPEQENEYPSPYGILKQMGIKEEVLTDMCSKHDRIKKFSGEPPVCTDGASMIVPFATKLVSLSSDKIVSQVAKRMGIFKAGLDEPFDRVISSLEDGDILTDEPEDICSGKLYKELNARILSAASVPSTKFGQSLIAYTRVLTETSGNSPNKMPLTNNLEYSDCDIMGDFRDEESTEEKDTSDSDMELNLADDRGQTGSTCPPNGSDSRSTAANVALLCASVKAAQHTLVEDVEIGRLIKLCVEVKLERVKRKMKHLRDVVEGEREMHHSLKRRREQVLGWRVRKKLLQLSGSVEISDTPVSRNSNSDNESLAPPSAVELGASSAVVSRHDSFLTRSITTPVVEMYRGPKLPEFRGREERLENVEVPVTILRDIRDNRNVLSDVMDQL